MSKIVEVQGLGNVEFPDTMDDKAIGAAIAKQLAPERPGMLRRAATWATTPFENVKPVIEQQRATAGAAPLGLTKDSGDLMAGAHAAVSGIPGYQQSAVSPEAAERAGRFRQDYPVLGTVLPLAAGMSKPGMLQQRAPAAVDPVLRQIQRVNGAVGSAAETLPALPRTLEFLLPEKVTKVYQFLRQATRKAAGVAEDPYPAGASVLASRPPPTSVLPQATAQTDPALQAAAAASRARVMATAEQQAAQAVGESAPEVQAAAQWQMPKPPPATAARIDPALESAAAESRARVMANAERMRMEPETPAPVLPGAAPPTPPAEIQSVLPQATAQPAAILNPFEAAGRAKKVAELVKAVDANAGMHLGVDMRDPRAAEALASLPAQWWEGMAQASGVNKPSQETINQALEFFRDRAAQGVPKLAAQ